MVEKDEFFERAPNLGARDLSLPAMERVLGILERLEAAGKERTGLTCQWLGGELGVSAKTVQRDLDFLKDRAGAPIEYDAQRHSWYLAGPVPTVFQTQLTEGELLALVVAQEAAGALAGTGLGETLSRAVNRLLIRADDEIDVSLGELQEGLSVREGAVVRSGAEVFEAIRKGMRARRVLAFEYRGLKDRRFLKRRVEPWQVAWVDGGWYLFGFDCKRQAERTFLLSRMRKVVLGEESFERPEGYSLGGRLRGSFGVFGVGREKVFRVRLRFDGFAAQLVREREWHPSQKIEEDLEGGLVLELKLSSLEEVERWVLSWGSHVEVLQPARLRKRLREVGAVLMEKYEDC